MSKQKIKNKLNVVTTQIVYFIIFTLPNKVVDFFLFYLIVIDHFIMKASEIYSMLNSITDDHTEISDFGGDSNADDYLPVNVCTTDKTTRSTSSSFSGNSSTISQLHSNE